MKRLTLLFSIGLFLLCTGCLPPVFNPPEGTYSDDIEVTISAFTYDTIFYTTDGSDPIPDSSLVYKPGYAIPVEGPGTTTIKAIAVFGFLKSPIASATYVIEYDAHQWYQDSDGDGYGNTDQMVVEETQPPGYVSNPGDCDDTNPDIHPEAIDICNDGIDQDCSGADLSCSDVDNDGDGYTENGGDCNDNNASIHPNAVEICGDGIDQDCSGADLSCSDVDNDGDGYTENGGDCNDSNASIHPNAVEICGDGIDQNCDGSDSLCPGDIDNDGDGYTPDQGDCNDNNPNINPGEAEICGDGIDQDCDGSDGVASWNVDPVSYDFSYIKDEKAFTVSNTGLCAIDVSVNASGTASWATISPLNTTINPGQSTAITVTVSRSALAQGTYSTSFIISSSEVGDDVTINITVSVGTAKILFCVDTSGSMAENDPDGKRVEAVNETITRFYSNTNVSFGIIKFSSNATTLTDNYTRSLSTLNSCASQLADADGWTTYLSGYWPYTPGALNEIDTRVDNSDTQTHYVIIFLSDGEPTTGNTDTNSIISKVTAISSSANIKLYTIYLYDEDEPNAQALLNSMAIAGRTEQTHVYTDPESLSFLDLNF